MNALVALLIFTALIGGMYLLDTRAVRRSLASIRACPNPLHRHEAPIRAAVMQTAAVLRVMALLAVGIGGELLRPWAGGWVDGWFGAIAGGVLAVAALLAVSAWERRRRQALDLSRGACG